MSRIIVVTGSREALDTEYNRARITAALKPMPLQATVFHGACRGAVRDAGNRGTKNCIDAAFGRRIDYRVIWLEGL